jgi:hypothetical protein
MKRLLDISLAIFAAVLMPTVVLAQSAQTLTTMMQNLDQSIPGIVQLTFAASYVMGVFLLLRAVYKFKTYAQGMSQMSSEKSIAKPIMLLIVAIGFLELPNVMDAFLGTMWNYDTNSVLSYPAATDPWSSFVNPLIDIVRVFGLISIVRGWSILAKLGAESHQEGVTGKAIIHIVGGICAWNIVGLWSVIQNTLGIA